MATRKIPFALSKTTDEEFQAALEQLAEMQGKSWEITDIHREERQQDGEKVPVGVIVVSKGV